MRLIDADALNKKICETTIFIKDGVAFQRMINDAPTIDAVPTDFHDKCMEIEISKRIDIEKKMERGDDLVETAYNYGFQKGYDRGRKDVSQEFAELLEKIKEGKEE